MKIYVASSWRNEHQPKAVQVLRAFGHEVYDFRNPKVGDNGFGWRQITPEPKPWPLPTLIGVLQHPVAVAGFESDFGAMRAAEACVLLLPCGRSAHLEAGWFIGAGRPVVVCGFPGEKHEPELMYRMTARMVVGIDELVAVFHYREFPGFPGVKL